jgi:tRNA1Val (adenine37-N6)-methyltransferase
MFKFKQFTINQENTAMKVCTDSCLFGAIVPAEKTQNILDIGTGTGLLALMLAQKNKDARITAIEIDNGACKDAAKNFENSFFCNQIKLVNERIQDFSESTEAKFDLIVCNPPFYQNKLKSPKAEKNIAHHATQLSFEDICTVINKLLIKEGSFWILLPPNEMENFSAIASKNKILTQEMITIRHNKNKEVLRQIGKYGFQENKANHSNEIEIRNLTNNEYSERYVALLKEYYLIF